MKICTFVRSNIYNFLYFLSQLWIATQKDNDIDIKNYVKIVEMLYSQVKSTKVDEAKKNMYHGTQFQMLY